MAPTDVVGKELFPNIFDFVRDLFKTSMFCCISITLWLILASVWLHVDRFGHPLGSMLVVWGTLSNPF